MFKPNAYSPKDKVGTETVLTRDMEAIKGTITKGSRVVITEVTDRGYSVKDLDSGEEIIECGFNL